jgi:DNA-binding beta-propeller fold protein YncE
LRNNFDGDSHSARLLSPSGIVVTPGGVIYVTDSGHNTIRRIDCNGNVATIAGSPSRTGTVDGKGVLATFSEPSGIALSPSGEIFVVDSGVLGTGRIRRIDPEGSVTSLRYINAGRPDFVRPHLGCGIAVAKDGTVFVTESTRIARWVPDGHYADLAGDQTEGGYRDGEGPEARFENVVAIAVGPDGCLYVTDKGNGVVRRITLSGSVTTFAGQAGSVGLKDGPRSSARFDQPVGLTFDAKGNLLIADLGNNCIRKIDTEGQVTTIAGTPGESGFVDGPADQAKFDRPLDVAVGGDGTIYVVDCFNNAVRTITGNGLVSTLVGNPESTNGARYVSR